MLLPINRLARHHLASENHTQRVGRLVVRAPCLTAAGTGPPPLWRVNAPEPDTFGPKIECVALHDYCVACDGPSAVSLEALREERSDDNREGERQNRYRCVTPLGRRLQERDMVVVSRREKHT